MTSREFKERLSKRARKLRVTLPDEVIEPFETYYRLLAKWNAKINLTSLPLQALADETLDRLFIEPLTAARLVDDASGIWFDLGSGGGSPALPLKLIRPALTLTLVESKTRKAAFLREVVRALKLRDTEVANLRFEELAPAVDHVACLVTVRAVRPDPALLGVAARLLKISGRLLLFGKPLGRLRHDEFQPEASAAPTQAVADIVTSYKRVFHVEQSR